MSRRSKEILNDLEIINELEEIFWPPRRSPDSSDDNLESDEDEVQYSSAKLQRILENYEEPNDRPIAPTPDPPSGPILQEVQPSSFSPIKHPPSPVSQSSHRGRPMRATRVEAIPSTSGTQQTLQPTTRSPVNVYDDAETDDSDGNEESWKKSKWTTYRPTPSIYDEVPMMPEPMYTSRIRPVTLFEKLFTVEVLESIAFQTNLYAKQKKVEGWTELDTKELKAFIGIIIIMGYNRLPSIDLYWSSDPGFRVDEIAETMPVKRFKKYCNVCI